MSSNRILRGGALRHVPMTWPSAGEPPPPEYGFPVSQSAGCQESPDEQIRRRVTEAHQSGYREGEAAGLKQAQAALEQLARALDDVAALRARVRHEAEADLVHLSVAIARRILHREIGVDPEALEGLVRAALDHLQVQEIHRVRIRPDHVPALRACLERLSKGARIEVIADPSQQSGGLIFETIRGDLDVSVETQLEEIERGLADRLRRRT